MHCLPPGPKNYSECETVYEPLHWIVSPPSPAQWAASPGLPLTFWQRLSSMAQVTYNYLGGSGVKVSNICLGTMTFGKHPVSRASLSWVSRPVSYMLRLAYYSLADQRGLTPGHAGSPAVIRSADCWRGPALGTLRTRDVIITLLVRQNDVPTSFWRNNDAIITSCARWGTIFIFNAKLYSILFHSMRSSVNSIWCSLHLGIVPVSISSFLMATC